jgi:hypothetical protein
MAKPWTKRVRKAVAGLGLTLAVPFLDRIFRGVFASAHITVQGTDSLAALRGAGGPILFAYWHRWAIHHLFHFSGGSHITMSSRKDAGELGYRVLSRHGYTTVRGASGVQSSGGWKDRGGRDALDQIIRTIRDTGYDAGLTVDGPHGPPLVVKPGIVLLAQGTGAPIVPMAVASRPRLVLPTWDRMHVPLPFSRIVYLFGDPLRVPSHAQGGGLEVPLRILQERMLALTQRAEAWFKGSPTPGGGGSPGPRAV